MVPRGEDGSTCYTPRSGHDVHGLEPPIRDLISKFLQKLMKWGIFDMADDPARTYARGRVAILGDTAHASTPFLGAGSYDAVIAPGVVQLSTQTLVNVQAFIKPGDRLLIVQAPV